MKANSCKVAAILAALTLGAPSGILAQAAGEAATPAVAAPVAPALSAPVESPAAAVKPTPVEVPTTAPASQGITEAGADEITIALDNVPVNQVVQMFARAAKANIVAPTLPPTNVTVHLENVQWEPALMEILGSVGLMLVKRPSGIYAVVPKEEAAAEPVISEIIFLNYTTSTNLLPVLEKMAQGSSNAAVAGFSGANAIVVRAPESMVKQIRDVVAKIDKPRDQVMIECKFVELNDQAIKDIGINWQSLQGWTVGVSSPQMALSRTITQRNSVNKDVKNANVDVDTQVNTSSKSSSSSSTANQNAQSGNSSGSSSEVNTPGGATQTDTTSSQNSSGASATATEGSSSANNAFVIAGKNFSDYDAAQNKVTLVPSRDARTENIDYGETEIVRALSAVLTADTFQATLSALQQNAGVEVVSNPKIVVSSGQTAIIHVGQNEPNIVALPQGDTGDRYSYQLDAQKPFIEIGVKLFVTPVMNTSNNISLKIKPELSRKLADKVVGGSAGLSFPVTQTRQVETEFNVRSGCTVALGGLTQSSDNEVVKKIPILGDIPIIGTYLFRHTHREKSQDEVIIFVTASSAVPDSLAQVSGIPDEAKLIHRHLAKKVEEAAKAEELATKKAPKAALPK